MHKAIKDAQVHMYRPKYSLYPLKYLGIPGYLLMSARRSWIIWR